MRYYLFRLIETRLEIAKKELVQKGLYDIFIIEDDSNGETFIGGHSKKKIPVEKIKSAELVEEKKAEIDWTQQWELFAENFTEGKAHIDLSKFGVHKTLLLTPGPGFGDLSHPTTYLMLEMMQNQIKNESIVDIGTGSGILSLAALLLGAKKAIGIDIDAAAIKHAKQNGKINHLKAQFSRTLPKKLPKEQIFLMNMIFPEQKIFQPQKLNPYAKSWIVSGILAEQKKEYLHQARKWGWTPLSENRRNEWIGWVFSTQSASKS